MVLKGTLMIKQLSTMLLLAMPAVSMADVTKTTLPDYAYDFASVGYEIEVTGTSRYFDALNAGDYFSLREGDYTMKTLFDGLSRKSRKAFVTFYNSECDYGTGKCQITVSGEVELDDAMGMVLTANSISITGAKTGETADFK